MFKGLGKKIRKVAGFVSRKIHGVFVVNVKHNVSWQDIQGFTHVESSIVTNFVTDYMVSVPRPIAFKIFRRYATTEKATRRMEEKGYRPATFAELLSVLLCPEKIPKRYRRRALVALGSCIGDISGNRKVPVSVGNATSKDLVLMDIKTRWPHYFRFLAVYEGKNP